MTAEVRVFAPGSVANFGVGFDALGAALDGPGDEVVARRVRRPGVRLVSVRGDRGRLPRESERNTASVAAAEVLKACGARFGLELALVKGLPLSSGLGSSAASAAAGAFAAAVLAGIPRTHRAVLSAVLRGENAADGSWHGDNAFSSLLGGLQLVPSSDPARPRSVALPYPSHLRLVLVHPALELRTEDARRVLAREVALDVHTRHSAAFAELVAALGRGDLRAAGRAMASDRIVEPRRAPLVPGHSAVVAAMRKAGAHGWALAGAGPSMCALTEERHEGDPRPEAIGRAAVEAFRRAGLVATARVHRLDAEGARVVSGSTRR